MHLKAVKPKLILKYKELFGNYYIFEIELFQLDRFTNPVRYV